MSNASLLNEILDRLNALPAKDREKLMQDAFQVTKNLPWIPNPGPQAEAFGCDADELFYGGQAGGGKSDLGIGLALTRHKRSLILREYIDDARSLGDRLLGIIGSRDGWNGQLLRYQRDDICIDFGGCKAEEDKQRYKGDPHDLIVFDEVGDFTESQYLFIAAWNRTTKPGQRCRIVATGNPPTRAKGLWVIKRWAAWLDPTHPNPAKPGELRWYTTGEDGREIEVDGPGPHRIGSEMVRARSRTFIRASLQDNPDLANTDYDATLAALPPELRQAYRDGRFDASLRDVPNQVIPTEWIRQAQARWTPDPPRGIPMCAIAADMSGGGDDPMVIARRHDGWFAPLIEIPGRDLPVHSMGRTAAGHILSVRADKALVVIDLGGGYGGSTYEHLKANDIEVSGYKGAEASTRRSRDGKLRFTNKRSAAYWLFREALDPGQPGGSPIMLPDDTRLVADLTAPTFVVTPHGIKVEEKKKVCERLGRSTDRGDAVVMAWHEGPKEITHALEWADQRQYHGMRGQRPQAIIGRKHASRR